MACSPRKTCFLRFVPLPLLVVYLPRIDLRHTAAWTLASSEIPTPTSTVRYHLEKYILPAVLPTLFAAASHRAIISRLESKCAEQCISWRHHDHDDDYDLIAASSLDRSNVKRGHQLRRNGALNGALNATPSAVPNSPANMQICISFRVSCCALFTHRQGASQGGSERLWSWGLILFSPESPSPGMVARNNTSLNCLVPVLHLLACSGGGQGREERRGKHRCGTRVVPIRPR